MNAKRMHFVRRKFKTLVASGATLEFFNLYNKDFYQQLEISLQFVHLMSAKVVQSCIPIIRWQCEIRADLQCTLLIYC